MTQAPAYYDRVIDLSTDEFWLLSIFALRDPGYIWTVNEIPLVLNQAGFLLADGRPWTDATVRTHLAKLLNTDWLSSVPTRSSIGYVQSAKAQVAIRRYGMRHLLADLSTLAMITDVLDRKFRRAGGGRRGRANRVDWRHLSEEQTNWLGLIEAAQVPGGLSSGLASVLGEMSYEEWEWRPMLAVFLPPFSDTFFAEMSPDFGRAVAQVAGLFPQYFPREELLRVASLASVDQDGERVSAHWLTLATLPDIPPQIADPRGDAAALAGRTRGQYPTVSVPGSGEVDALIGAHLHHPLRHLRLYLEAGVMTEDRNRVGKFMNSVATQELYGGLLYFLWSDEPGPARNLETTWLRCQRPPRPVALLLLLLALDGKGWRLPPLVLLPQTVDLLDGRTGHLAQYPWLASELLRLVSRLLPNQPKAAEWGRRAAELREEHGFHPLKGQPPPEERWRGFLDFLGKEHGTGPATAPPDPAAERPGAKRLVYILERGLTRLQVREQTFGKKGWTPGRKISPQQFRELAGLHPRDEPLAEALRDGYGDILPRRPRSLYSPEAYHYYRTDAQQWDIEHAVYLLADHPYVLEGDKLRQPLRVERGQPELVVEHDENGNLEVRMNPPGLPLGYSFRRPAPGRLVAYDVDEDAHLLGKQVPPEGMHVPADAADRLDQLLPRIRRTVNVVSSTDWMNEGLPEVEGQPLPCLHLVSDELGGHRLEAYIKPLPEGSYYFRPGEGMQRGLIASEEEGRRVLRRDFAAERAALEQLIQDQPLLNEAPHEEYEWHFASDERMLQLLQDLRPAVGSGAVVLEYPKGQRIRLGAELDEDALSIRVASGRDWFSVDANLATDEERVVDFELILEGMRNADRFVRVGEGDYVTLTDGLRDRLARVAGLLTESRGGHELSPLAAGAFSEAIAGLDHVEVDREWREALERLERVKAFTPPPPPADFRAELRDYQRRGFAWMARLAEWGVGGCLADDMGLGKTVQALALLSQRAGGGPALVIAPASVVRNWRNETLTFAPALNPRLIPSAAEAAGILSDLHPGDVVLLSFGLLTYLDEKLRALQWHTLVVDEAQAIKNPATKRARLVRDLTADFKLATTGTPIENNLTELWSLFRFLNPGLFGSLERFRRQFQNPIANGDEKSREQLRRVIQPFILRRRKDEVLRELPPKTEIVRTVDPYPEEAAFYEAYRRQALRDIEQADQQRARFVVLQQLTQLRQAACNARLLKPRTKVPSAKLDAVGETIREIVDGGHKALVFSQFVKHLKLVEKWVKSEKIPYQYLDGSTPSRVRQQRVDAFQNGQGQLFLISLKAGGTGLNLTEADFVLHLDPWWNPAAEDQASDRAHRIGQQRPVTVYRFVTAGTIEEQIIDLHADKRDLADQILAGTNRAGSLSVSEVVNMLRSEND